ncbi:MAG: hypothetical protein J5608_01510 [Alphaproteobacteria bacterium]|nr:hypothetical protein [Alphaproteobacteria bacterium]
MKFSKVFQYILLGALVSVPKISGNFVDTGDSLHAQQVVNTNVPTVKEMVNAKAQDLCELYISNVLRGQQNIKNSDKSYFGAVRTELPGAPVKMHCVYGQYTQLTRALNELNDTLTVIPFDARNACSTFRNQMKKKYAAPEFAGALHNGKMFKSEESYNRALKAFLVHNNVTDKTPQDVKDKIIAKFEQNNYKADDLHPGTILIIQRGANPNNAHAVMYLGRGRVENRKDFIPDSNGVHIYAGYNNESVGDLFLSFNTNHVFAADVYTIASALYTDEYNKIQNMDQKELFQFVYDTPSDKYAFMPRKEKLQTMAAQKYFNKETFVPAVPEKVQNMAQISPIPGMGLLKGLKSK